MYYNEYIFSEWVVIIGIRSESKQKTRELILAKTALLLHNKGFLKMSSKEIARECNLSQGSIFLHFETKENLLNTILSSNITKFEIDLKKNCIPNYSKELFLKNYIDVLIQNESFLSRAYKDLPYLPDTLSKSLNGLETTTKNLFFENLRKNPEKKLSIVDSFISIDAFFAQIQKNLLEKEVYTEFNSIIRQRRGKIIKLYRTLFE
ncbi:MAG: DNA-binding transcriptional repressor FabR [Candidatus Izimaplasma bacterium HR2]|nr:MAG: DNA-binding transcriptional repressor FabR [Candidatus Izimaplasma bacterium HR2]